MRVAEYGDLTPRELMFILDEHNYQSKLRLEEAVYAAYMPAYWQRVKKLPSLKQVLKDSRPREQSEQSPEEMAEVVKRLNAAFGGTTY